MSDKNNKINVYKIHNGEILELPVEKTTDRIAFIPRHKAFRFARGVNIECVCFTPHEAIKEARGAVQAVIKTYESRIESMQQRLIEIDNLAKNTPQKQPNTPNH